LAHGLDTERYDEDALLPDCRYGNYMTTIANAASVPGGDAEAAPRVLIVESDPSLARHVSADLQAVGYEIIMTDNADQGFQQVLDRLPSLVVVDRNLADNTGLTLCSRLRRRGLHVPVLLLLNQDAVADRVACLEAGADDYLVKQPYRTDDLLKMVQFYLKTEVLTQSQLRFGELVLDLSLRQVIRNGRAIDLTMKEFELLKYLMEHPREVLSREQILENVWGFDYVGESNVIEVYIRYLRLKIEDEGQKRLIQTVRGIGYVLREN
jgi:two-component system, OmpR family, response regulator NblR